jgi:uncharacterized membrane protein
MKWMSLALSILFFMAIMVFLSLYAKEGNSFGNKSID